MERYQFISQGKDKQELGAGQHASSESLQRLCIAEHGVRGAAKHAIAHERLAIIDPESGAQPLFAAECKDSTGKILIEEGSIIVAANGEIYNYKELYDLLKKEGVPYEPNTGSDCEVLIPLYVKFGLEKACSLLRGADLRGNQIYAMAWRLTNHGVLPTGMFSFIIYDQRTGFYGAARDHIGITSLYLGRGFGRVGLDRVGDEVAGERLPRRRAVQAGPLLAERHAAVRPVVRPDVAVWRVPFDALRLYEAEATQPL